MLMRRAALLLVWLYARSAAVAAPPPVAVYSGVERVVAIGDLHGDYEKFSMVLRLCRLTNDKGQWIAGKTHLVQTGDVLDRGPDSKKILDRLMELEAQAERAGGRVHALIGNHEYMTMTGDLRYVSDGELSAFGDGPRLVPLGQVPLGHFPRYRAAFSPAGPYGRFIAAHNAIVKINGTLFLHGGLSPRYMNRDIAELNELVRAELRGARETRAGVGTDPEGPLWFRGLAEPHQPEVQAAYLQALLAAQKARRIVIGHTIQERGITLREGGRLVLIDVGMSKMTLGAPPSCLVIEGGEPGDRLSIIKP